MSPPAGGNHHHWQETPVCAHMRSQPRSELVHQRSRNNGLPVPATPQTHSTLLVF